ncbi:MAG TPA: adenylate kinase [Acidimicrobiales bacterium]|nr:adenylate kinase [Acidimicrobiales bacterium]
MPQSGPRLVILGKQGAGKGTQCMRLSRHYVVPHISSGEMFRAELKSGSEAGQRLNKFMKAGELVPDDVVIDVMAHRLTADGTKDKGFILDGFPRTTTQAEALFDLLAPEGLDLAVDLQVPTEVVLRRLAARRVCQDCGANYSVDSPPAVDWICDRCGGEVVQREDDREEVIARRLRLYEQETEPLVAWYLRHDKLVAVDGLGPPDVVTGRLVQAIDGRLGGAAA